MAWRIPNQRLRVNSGPDSHIGKRIRNNNRGQESLLGQLAKTTDRGYITAKYDAVE
jgi:hypothetical protein